MAVQINSGLSTFRVGTEGAGECGVWEWNGRLFMLGFDVAGIDGPIQIWYSEDDGATWAEADSANRPESGGTIDLWLNDFSIGTVGCQVGGTLYFVYARSDSGGSYLLTVTAFSFDTLTYGRTILGGPLMQPNFDHSECISSILPIPGGLRILFLTDTPGFSYNTYFTDLDLATETWAAHVQVNATDNNRHYPCGMIAGAGGRTHAFYKNDHNSSDVGYQRTINADGSLEAEQAITPTFGLTLSGLQFGLGHSIYSAASGVVKLATCYHGPFLTSPDRFAFTALAADSAAEPAWTETEITRDPVYAGSASDGCISSCCYFGHDEDLHLFHTGMPVANLPRSAGEMDLYRTVFGNSPAVFHDAGGTKDVTSVRVRPITGGLGVLFVVDYEEVWFEKLALDACGGGGVPAVDLVGGAY